MCRHGDSFQWLAMTSNSSFSKIDPATRHFGFWTLKNAEARKYSMFDCRSPALKQRHL
jgi:hypothetical protein